MMPATGLIQASTQGGCRTEECLWQRHLSSGLRTLQKNLMAMHHRGAATTLILSRATAPPSPIRRSAVDPCARQENNLRPTRHTKLTAASARCVQNAEKKWGEAAAANGAQCRFRENSMYIGAGWGGYALGLTGTGALSTSTTARHTMKLGVPSESARGVGKIWEGLSTGRLRDRAALNVLFQDSRLTAHN